MEISNRGLNLIKKYEGLRLEAYKCPAGVVTIGYGHTSTAYMGMVITSSKADALLRGDLEKAQEVVSATSRQASTSLTQSQFDALVSFVFNCGSGNFLGSTLRRKVIANPADGTIGTEFGKWVNAGGKKMPGLVARRREEADLYFD